MENSQGRLKELFWRYGIKERCFPNLYGIYWSVKYEKDKISYWMWVSDLSDYWMQDLWSSYKTRRSRSLVDMTKKEEVLFIYIILQWIINRSFGQWVHWSCPWSYLDSGSIYLLQLLTGLESLDRDLKSPNRDWYVVNIVIDS